MIGVSSSMLEIFELVRRVAPARSTVLISGESGTGKEGVARALHALSDRAAAPFVAVHCAALNPNLLESELFGHEKGAFTSATGRRAGRFEAADGGTVFLDEIGEIDPSTQVKLLRILETRSFERVGGTETLRVDVRIVAATNRDLKKMVDDGRFREDLYYRLDVIRVHLPPLRERPEDIPGLLAAALAQACTENRRQIRGFTPAALSLLARHSWPGNVRELRNVVEGSVVRCRGELIDLGDLPASLGEGLRPALNAAPSPAPQSERSLDVSTHERQLILEALRRSNNSRTEAAKLLGMSRRTLHRRLQELGIENGEA
jgi:DNA-binding NtrC family response regulator